MVIFIDETGDLGFDFTKQGTSSHFVITALVLTDHRVRRRLEKAVGRTIKNKLNVRKKAKRKPIHELKGRNTSLEVKSYFWRHAQSVPFQLYTIALNKERVYPKLQRKKERLYNYVARLLVDRIPVDEAGGSLHVEIDKSKGQRQREEFNGYLRRHIEGRTPPEVRLSIHHVRSDDSKGIQAADMFSWGIFRKYRQGDHGWYELFRGRIAFETLYLPP